MHALSRMAFLMVLTFLTAVAVAAEPAVTAERHVYERGETFAITVNAPGATAARVDVNGWITDRIELTDGAAEWNFDTGLLRAGDYLVRVAFEGASEATTAFFPFTLAPAHDAERIPVWRWGGGTADPAWWQQRGFTGAFIFAPQDLVKDGDAIVKRYKDYLDEATRLDFEMGLYFRTLDSEHLVADESVRVVNTNGTLGDKPYPLEPAVIAHAEQVTEQSMALWGDYPGLRHVMFNSEWQTPFCLNECAVKDAREQIGVDIHQFFDEKGGFIPIPAEDVNHGIIADDNPHYRLLQWWWHRGHGTAPLNEAQNAVVKRYRPDVITWHEPYRLAPVRGAAKGLDCIATWTYGHPDIKRLCYTTYLQAAARPEHQLVQQDITLFVYGRYAVPIGESTSDYSRDFAGNDPYFTAGPDYAREALWLVLSQRPDILCFYSAGALSPDNPTLDPTYSSPETFDAIGQTCEVLVKPYGPMIRACTRTHPEVAVLMSAASTWFSASPRLPGYPTEQTLPYATLLMMNHVPFDVLLDEDIAEGALEQYRVLVMPKADTMTQTMGDRITAFAQGGGTVIADVSLRANIPGVHRTEFDFTPQLKIDGKALVQGDALTAEENRAMMEDYAKQLAPQLSEVSRPAQAATPRVLTNSLDGGAARYHFFINDARTYGPRFGEWELREELGIRQTATVHIPIGERPILYDTLERKQIEYEIVDDHAVFSLQLPAARGKLIAALPETLTGVRVTGPSESMPGRAVQVSIEVLGASGEALKSVHPLRVDVIDPRGRDSEWSRYSTTRDGVCTFTFTPAINYAPGTWSVRVTELVGGYKGEFSVECIADF